MVFFYDRDLFIGYYSIFEELGRCMFGRELNFKCFSFGSVRGIFGGLVTYGGE